MQFISTSELRTKSKQLIEQLAQGKTIKLLHRSKVVGKIKPQKDLKPDKINANAFSKAMRNLARNTPNLTTEEMEKNYREHMEEKYGKHIS
jgi:antitoxin (DNA-binding transcriptional repressor) of toxin-antitoxin stability system